jgi:hypothetical protein
MQLSRLPVSFYLTLNSRRRRLLQHNRYRYHHHHHQILLIGYIFFFGCFNVSNDFCKWRKETNTYIHLLQKIGLSIITIDSEMIFVCCNRECNLFCKCTRRILIVTEKWVLRTVWTHVRRFLGRYGTWFDEETNNYVVSDWRVTK